jgi:hypothetical protein
MHPFIYVVIAGLDPGNPFRDGCGYDQRYGMDAMVKPTAVRFSSG